MKTVNLNQIATETRNPNTLDLDKLSPRQIAKKINDEDFNAARAVKAANKEIAAICFWPPGLMHINIKLFSLGRAPADVWEFWKQWSACLLLAQNPRKLSV